MSRMNSKPSTNTSESQFVKKFLWLRKNFAYCLSIITLSWIVGLCYYVHNFIGWSSIGALNPLDFAYFLLLSTLPLLAFWFVLAYIERSSSLDANAELFHNYIDNLMYPDDKASKTATAISKALLEQMTKLQTENRRIVEQSTLLKNDLDLRISEFGKILQILDNYSANTLTQLNDEIKNLSDKCTYINDKTVKSVNRMQDCSEIITQNSDRFLSKINPIVDEISALSANIKNNIADNRSNLADMKTQIAECSDISKDYIENILEKTNDNISRIERSFYKASEEYDMLYKKLDNSISGIEGRIDDQKQLIYNQSQLINKNSELFNDKLNSYGRLISEEIEKLVKNSVDIEKIAKQQINTLKAISNETNKSVLNIGGVFDEKRAEIERKCEYAITSMQNVIIAINKETEKLTSFTALTQAKNFDLQNVAETIVDKIGDISNKLALKTDSLKDNAVDVIDKFNEASEIIAKSTDKINTSSNLVIDSGRQGVKLLEEQSFYINNTVSNIDRIREKLEGLRGDVKDVSNDVSVTLSGFEKQINRYETIKDNNTKINPIEPTLDYKELNSVAQNINKILKSLGVSIDEVYQKKDVFDLWDDYIKGNQTAFVDAITNTLSNKNIKAIRKAFDDNTLFHNLVIKYLFLMDLVIKEVLNSEETTKNEIINLSANSALDKVYFVLVKALNSVE